jgi:hypothetical protein
MKKLIETYRVSIASFCKKHKAELKPEIIAEFAMAWREQRDFEWTPLAEVFRRILAVRMDEINPNWVAIVFGYSGIDRELTRELNETILRFNQEKWVE